MEHSSRTLITFDCNHTRMFTSPTPTTGEVIWCLRCRRERRVIAAPGEWKLKCRNCIYSRRFGQAQLNTEISAAKHRMKYPHHVVDIYNGQEVRKTFGVQRDQIVMESKPDCDQLPGF